MADVVQALPNNVMWDTRLNISSGILIKSNVSSQREMVAAFAFLTYILIFCSGG